MPTEPIKFIIQTFVVSVSEILEITRTSLIDYYPPYEVELYNNYQIQTPRPPVPSFPGTVPQPLPAEATIINDTRDITKIEADFLQNSCILFDGLSYDLDLDNIYEDDISFNSLELSGGQINEIQTPCPGPDCFFQNQDYISNYSPSISGIWRPCIVASDKTKLGFSATGTENDCEAGIGLSSFITIDNPKFKNWTLSPDVKLKIDWKIPKDYMRCDLIGVFFWYRYSDINRETYVQTYTLQDVDRYSEYSVNDIQINRRTVIVDGTQYILLSESLYHDYVQTSNGSSILKYGLNGFTEGDHVLFQYTNTQNRIYREEIYKVSSGFWENLGTPRFIPGLDIFMSDDFCSIGFDAYQSIEAIQGLNNLSNSPSYSLYPRVTLQTNNWDNYRNALNSLLNITNDKGLQKVAANENPDIAVPMPFEDSNIRNKYLAVKNLAKVLSTGPLVDGASVFTLSNENFAKVMDMALNINDTVSPVDLNADTSWNKLIKSLKHVYGEYVQFKDGQFSDLPNTLPTQIGDHVTNQRDIPEGEFLEYRQRALQQALSDNNANMFSRGQLIKNKKDFLIALLRLGSKNKYLVFPPDKKSYLQSNFLLSEHNQIYAYLDFEAQKLIGTPSTVNCWYKQKINAAGLDLYTKLKQPPSIAFAPTEKEALVLSYKDRDDNIVDNNKKEIDILSFMDPSIEDNKYYNQSLNALYDKFGINQSFYGKYDIARRLTETTNSAEYFNFTDLGQNVKLTKNQYNQENKSFDNALKQKKDKISDFTRSKSIFQAALSLLNSRFTQILGANTLSVYPDIHEIYFHRLGGVLLPQVNFFTLGASKYWNYRNAPAPIKDAQYFLPKDITPNFLNRDANDKTLKIEFETSESLRISFYDIKVETLRVDTLENSNCRPFPNKVPISSDSTRVFDQVIAYEFNETDHILTTQYSPPIVAYGGHRQEDISSINLSIPGHPEPISKDVDSGIYSVLRKNILPMTAKNGSYKWPLNSQELADRRSQLSNNRDQSSVKCFLSPQNFYSDIIFRKGFFHPNRGWIDYSLLSNSISYQLNWTTSYNGTINGDPWSITSNNTSIKFTVEDSANCVNGGNPNTQSGKAVATINIGDMDVLLGVSFSGVGEKEDPDFELISLSLNGQLLASAHAPGGQQGCSMGPVVQTPAVIPKQKLKRNTSYTFEIDFTTNDGLYHLGAYYQVDLQFEASNTTTAVMMVDQNNCKTYKGYGNSFQPQIFTVAEDALTGCISTDLRGDNNNIIVRDPMVIYTDDTRRYITSPTIITLDIDPITSPITYLSANLVNFYHSYPKDLRIALFDPLEYRWIASNVIDTNIARQIRCNPDNSPETVRKLYEQREKERNAWLGIWQFKNRTLPRNLLLNSTILNYEDNFNLYFNNFGRDIKYSHNRDKVLPVQSLDYFIGSSGIYKGFWEYATVDRPSIDPDDPNPPPQPDPIGNITGEIAKTWGIQISDMGVSDSGASCFELQVCTGCPLPNYPDNSIYTKLDYNGETFNSSWSPGYNFMANFKDKLHLIPPVNIDAPFSTIDQTQNVSSFGYDFPISLPCGTQPDLPFPRETIKEPPPAEPVFLPPLFPSLVGILAYISAVDDLQRAGYGWDLGFLAGVYYPNPFSVNRPFKERQAEYMINKGFLQIEGTTAAALNFYKYQKNLGLYDTYPYGIPNKIQLEVQHQNGLWYNIEADIFRYTELSSPVLENKKFTYIKYNDVISYPGFDYQINYLGDKKISLDGARPFYTFNKGESVKIKYKTRNRITGELTKKTKIATIESVTLPTIPNPKYVAPTKIRVPPDAPDQPLPNEYNQIENDSNPKNIPGNTTYIVLSESLVDNNDRDLVFQNGIILKEQTNSFLLLDTSSTEEDPFIVSGKWSNVQDLNIGSSTSSYVKDQLFSEGGLGWGTKRIQPNMKNLIKTDDLLGLHNFDYHFGNADYCGKIKFTPLNGIEHTTIMKYDPRLKVPNLPKNPYANTIDTQFVSYTGYPKPIEDIKNKIYKHNILSISDVNKRLFELNIDIPKYFLDEELTKYYLPYYDLTLDPSLLNDDLLKPLPDDVIDSTGGRVGERPQDDGSATGYVQFENIFTQVKKVLYDSNYYWISIPASASGVLSSSSKIPLSITQNCVYAGASWASTACQNVCNTNMYGPNRFGMDVGGNTGLTFVFENARAQQLTGIVYEERETEQSFYMGCGEFKNDSIVRMDIIHRYLVPNGTKQFVGADELLGETEELKVRFKYLPRKIPTDFTFTLGSNVTNQSQLLMWECHKTNIRNIYNQNTKTTNPPFYQVLNEMIFRAWFGERQKISTQDTYGSIEYVQQNHYKWVPYEYDASNKFDSERTFF